MRKILFLALIAILILPVPGFTQDVSVNNVEIKWLNQPTSCCRFRAKVYVTNISESLYYINGRLNFYDCDGFIIDNFPFHGKIEAGDTVPFNCGGRIIGDKYWEVQSYEAIITNRHKIPW